jgi:hypothetical protein
MTLTLARCVMAKVSLRTLVIRLTISGASSINPFQHKCGYDRLLYR